ncbi:MAG TPA: serine/threonine-protein kinase [Ktedonobacteraceae bacterium]|nr:serine/threonine-protein kinase [Ktedonobacteraceae bacterium]
MNRDLSEQRFGNYRLVRRLGGGGFADVYLGQHVRITTQQAAIKILHLTDVDESQFQQEAERTASLRHPHIVRVYDFDIQQGTPFLVLDYAPNGSLASKHKGQQLSLDTIVQYLKQIAPALQYAHDNNLIHRDIKPDNILVGSQGELLVSDFGIAVIAKTGRTSIQSTYNIGGTPYYMAPEMFRGKPEKASDQYSLGIMVYTWLCGRPPFIEGDFIQLGFQHTAEPVPLLHEQVPIISPQVEQVVMRALAKSVPDRFPSVQAFADALEAAYGQPASPVNRVASIPATVFVANMPVVKSVIPSKGSAIGTMLLKYTKHSGNVPTVAWSPDGRRLASGSDDETVQVWDASTGQHLCIYRGHSGNVPTVAWSPDGRRLASGSDDETVQVWDASTGLRFTNYRAVGVSTVMWSPDGYRLVFGSGRTAQVWDANTGQRILIYTRHSGHVTSVALSPDGRRLASGSRRTAQVWDTNNFGQLFFTYTGHSDRVSSVAWSPDGRRLASGSDDETAQVWDASTGQRILIYTGHTGHVTSVVWSPDGRWLASSSYDKTVQVWDASTGNLIYVYQGHTEPVLSVAWSPDGMRIASAAGREVHIWQAI